MEEITGHIKAVGEWASQDSKRVAFVMSGELTDGGIHLGCSLVGRTDRIVSAFISHMAENEEVKKIVTLAAKAVENPLAAAVIMGSAHDEEDKECSGLLDGLKQLLGKLGKGKK